MPFFIVKLELYTQFHFIKQDSFTYMPKIKSRIIGGSSLSIKLLKTNFVKHIMCGLEKLGNLILVNVPCHAKFLVPCLAT